MDTLTPDEANDLREKVTRDNLMLEEYSLQVESLQKQLVTYREKYVHQDVLFEAQARITELEKALATARAEAGALREALEKCETLFRHTGDYCEVCEEGEGVPCDDFVDLHGIAVQAVQQALAAVPHAEGETASAEPTLDQTEDMLEYIRKPVEPPTRTWTSEKP